MLITLTLAAGSSGGGLDPAVVGGCCCNCSLSWRDVWQPPAEEDDAIPEGTGCPGGREAAGGAAQSRYARSGAARDAAGAKQC